MNAPRWLAGALVLAAVLAHAQPAAGPPALGTVWQEQVIGHPERPGEQSGRALRQMPKDRVLYTYEDGLYKSVAARIRLKLPRLQDEKEVTVREGVPFRRADGMAATAHLIFLPGAAAVQPTADNQAISAVVVTRLRDDRPRDRESILRNWEPRSTEEAERMRQAGVTTRRFQSGPFGEALERVTRNRASTEPFPYQLNILKSNAAETIGVTRLLVAGEDSLLEFSQVYPCGAMAEEACRSAALAASDRFIQGVSEFLTFTK